MDYIRDLCCDVVYYKSCNGFLSKRGMAMKHTLYKENDQYKNWQRAKKSNPRIMLLQLKKRRCSLWNDYAMMSIANIGRHWYERKTSLRMAVKHAMRTKYS
jgi:hypothetical protein